MDKINFAHDSMSLNDKVYSEGEPASFNGIIGRSECMQDIYWKIELVAQNGVTVLITGESGTGKELVARAIHNLSNRSSGPFFAINLGALSNELVASELFGHERGAFTGATELSEGVFESAEGGTLFLDEVSSLDTKSQVSLLRVLENREYRRVGGKRMLKTDARIIAATNKNLLNVVKKGSFRKDLYYRLEVFTLNMPPLRERWEDIPLLVTHFISQFNKELGKGVRGISKEALEYLLQYKWPGNVRELKNSIKRAMILSNGDVITPEDLHERILMNEVKEKHDAWEIGLPLREVEKRYIEQTLRWSQGNKMKTARMLRISRRALYNKIEAYNL